MLKITELTMTHRNTAAAPARSNRLSIVDNIRTVVLLAGAIRLNTLRRATGRSLLDLPLDARRNILDHWRLLLVEMAAQLHIAPLPVRAVVDHAVNLAPAIARHGPVEISLEQDPEQYRGTGGLLSDIAREYDDHDYLLVANASQLPLRRLAQLTLALADTAADAALLCCENAEPAGFALIRCQSLRDINPIGFIDFNEQALPAISRKHDVRVVRLPAPAARPIRTLPAYLAALRDYHQHQQHARRQTPCQQWESAFAVIEPGASVHHSALLHDSVVLAGARVEPGAVLVRSIVGDHASVAAGQSIVDGFVIGPGKHRPPAATP